MTPACARFSGRIPGFLADSLPNEERRELREHLRCCPACRDVAAEADPTLLFSALPAEEISSEEVAQVLEAVRAGIAWKQAERRIRPRPPRAGRVASAAAVVLATLALPGGLRIARREPAASPMVVSRPEAAPAGGFAVLADPEDGRRHPADATIYDWTPDSGQPRVVWIVDRSLDI